MFHVFGFSSGRIFLKGYYAVGLGYIILTNITKQT